MTEDTIRDSASLRGREDDHASVHDDTLAVAEVLLSHASVLDARVDLVEGASGGRLLSATVTLKEGHAPSDELRHELAWYVKGDIPTAPAFREIEFLEAGEPAGEGGTGSTPTAVPAGEPGELVYVSGHPVDTAEVRMVLESVDAVRKAGVTGVPDPKKGQLLKAVVTLASGVEGTEDLKSELAWEVNVNVGPMALFSDIVFQGEERSRQGQTERSPAPTPGRSGGMVVVDSAERGGDSLRVTSHRISTTEVTNALLSHPDVVDAAALTVPDERHGEILKAFVKLRGGVEPTNDLRLELAWHVMAQLKPVAIFSNLELETPEDGRVRDGIEEEVTISGKTVLSADVEKTLAAHPSVREVAVIGVPDEVHGEALQAFVIPAEGVSPGEELREELAWHARTGLGPHVVFKFIEFRGFLPKVDSPGTMRSVLKADVLNIPTRMSINVVD